MITLQYPALASHHSTPTRPRPSPESSGHDSGWPREAMAGRHHIDTTRAVALAPDVTQGKTCRVRTDEAEELLVGTAEGKGRRAELSETAR